MIRGRTIICIASNWFDHPTSKQHVMRHLSRENDVVWVNFHASRRPSLSRTDLGRIGRRLRHIWAGPVQPRPRLRVLTPPLLPWPASPAARWLNARILRRHIAAALRRLPPQQPVQLWLFAPDVPELIERLAAERVVYYCVDDFAEFAGYDAPLMRRLEQRTIALADIVIATSPKLYRERARAHSCVHYVPHGVDFEHFAAVPAMPESAVPPDLAGIPRPRLGYMGLISDYLDLELIAGAAAARPAWSFVFLGDIGCDVSVLRRRPNVHLLGGRRYESLPAYCRGLDVGLIPFCMNALVQAVNPIKLREYLAAGLPVVSAPMDAVLPYTGHTGTAVLSYSGHTGTTLLPYSGHIGTTVPVAAVQLASDLPEFLRGCERAIEASRADPPGNRQSLVFGESWAARVAELSRLVMTLPETDATKPEAPASVHGSAPEAPAPASRKIFCSSSRKTRRGL